MKKRILIRRTLVAAMFLYLLNPSAHDVLKLARVAHAATPQEATPVNKPTVTSMASASGHFRVKIVKVPEKLPMNKLHSWTLHVETPDGKPVTGATIQVEGGMPEHGHGFATAPSVTELRAGDYVVNGLKFQMPGYWEIAFNIKAGKVIDRAQFRAYLE